MSGMRVKSEKNEIPSDLSKAAEEAINQIDKKRYTAVLSQQQIKNCLKIGIAFNGKHHAISYRNESLDKK